MSEQETLAPWHDDRLGYRELGETFTNLVTSITDTRVISIEAGFGHGKTYFRKNWAQHLRDAGEVVIEIDAMLSDHSGEPVLTFLGAMLEQIATTAPSPSKFETAKAAAKKIGGVFVRTGVKAFFRSGADEIINFAAEQSDSATLNEITKDVGGTLSNVVAGMIDSQLATENARKRELPEQLRILREQLTDEKDTKRVIVIVDELDRCHPEYAIALLEAMKVVFNLDGFVFCLMVNPKHLEQIASRRFGFEGEDYVDKFIDLRLQLRADKDARGIAARDYVLALPNYIPFGDGHDFSKERAAEIAEKVTTQNPDGVAPITMRQIKRAVDRVEIALLNYSDKPLDLPLLVYLSLVLQRHGWVTEMASSQAEKIAKYHGLERAKLIPSAAAKKISGHPLNEGDAEGNPADWKEARNFLWEHSEEFFRSIEQRQFRPGDYFRSTGERALIKRMLLRYIPEHEEVLDAACQIVAG